MSRLHCTRRHPGSCAVQTACQHTVLVVFVYATCTSCSTATSTLQLLLKVACLASGGFQWRAVAEELHQCAHAANAAIDTWSDRSDANSPTLRNLAAPECTKQAETYRPDLAGRILAAGV